jgi:hypothetical protein
MAETMSDGSETERGTMSAAGETDFVRCFGSAATRRSRDA